MSINIFYGTDNEMLDMRCKEIITHCADKNIFFIVPEQFSMSAEQYFSDVTKIGFEVISFKRLAGRIFEDAGKIGGSYLSASSKIMLMQSVLDTEKLGIYSECAEKSGFASAMVKTISEFKHAAIDVDFVKAKTEGTDGILREKLQDFSVVYEAYNKKTEMFGKDSDDDLTFVYKLLLQKPNLYSVKDSVIIISKFSGFTRQERLLIRLFASCCDVYISAVTDSLESDCAICFEPTVLNLKQITEGFAYKTEKIEGTKKYSAPAHLALNYFGFPPKKSESKDVTVLKYPNSYNEINAVAQEILRLCRCEGMRFRDIAVCYRNADEYKTVLERVFKNNGIPAFMDNKENISSNALIVFVYSIADIFEYNYSCDSLSALVKSIFIPVEREDADIFENFVLAYGLFGKKFADDELWNKKTAAVFKRDNTAEKVVNRTRRAVIAPLKRFRQKTSGKQSYRIHAHALFELLCDFGVYRRLEEIINGLNKCGRVQLAKEYSQVWNIFINTLDEAVKFLPDVKTGFSKFMNVIKAALNEFTVGTVPPVADCVTVSDAQRFVPGKIKALFAVGVCSGEFPPPAGSGGVFDETDRDILEGLGIELSNSKKRTAVAEQQILYKVFSAPSEKIYFSYRTTNFDGTAAAEGEVISKVKEIFPQAETRIALPQVGSPYYTFERIAKEKVHKGNVFDWFISQKEWERKAKLILNETKPDGNVRLSEESVKKLYENGFSGSVSKLETYSKCAFSYFLNYNLKLKPRKMYTLSAPDAGTLVHSVLEECVRDAAEKNIWESVNREMCAEMTENAVKRVAPEFLDGLFLSSPRYRYVLSKLTKQLSGNLYYILNRFGHSKFRPEGFEIDFDSEQISDMNLVSSRGEKIRLTGKIDRADIMEKNGCKYLRIIDYKTGNKELKLKDVYNGTNLQLLTYLDALCGSKNKPAGVLYCVISSAVASEKNILSQKEIEAKLKGRYAMRGLVLENGDIIADMDDDPGFIGLEGRRKGGSATDEQFELLRYSVRKSVKELSSAILGGDISINPPYSSKNSSDSSCNYCEFHAVCRGVCSHKVLSRFDSDEEVYSQLAENRRADSAKGV